MLIKFILDSVKHGLLIAVDLVPDRLTLVERQAFDFVAQLGYSLVVGFGGVCDVATHLVYAVAEAVVVELRSISGNSAP